MYYEDNDDLHLCQQYQVANKHDFHSKHEIRIQSIPIRIRRDLEDRIIKYHNHSMFPDMK